MRLLAFLFLFSLLLKVLLVGVSHWVAQYMLPGVMLALVASMFMLSRSARIGLREYEFLSPLLLMLLIFSWGTLLSLINGLEYGDSISAVLRLLTMVAVTVGAFMAAQSGSGRLGFLVLYASFFVHILAAVVLYFFGVGYEIDGVLRPTGLTGRPQLIANIASLAVVFYLCYLLSGRERGASLLIVGLGLIFVAVSGTLKNFLAVLLISSMALLSFPFRYRQLVILVGSIVLFVLGYFAVTNLPIGERLTEAMTAGLTTDVAVGDRLESSLMWRMLHWRLLIADWYENYQLLGAGIGQVPHLNALKTDSGSGFAAHSDWVGFFVELGPVVFPLLVLSQVWIYRMVKAGVRRGDEGYFALRFSFLLLVVMAAGGNVFYSAAHLYQFWWLVGLISGSAAYARAMSRSRW